MKMDEVSGVLKLRMPRSLHFELITQAAKEGVSVNQFCVATLLKNLVLDDALLLGYKKTNSELLHIRKISIDDDELFERVMDFRRKIYALKPMLFQKIFSVKKTRGIPENDIIDLEARFPVISGRHFHEELPRVKIPNLKLVITWDIDEDLATNIIKSYLQNSDENISTNFYPGYVDQLDQSGEVFRYKDNRFPVYTVIMWGQKFDQVKKCILNLKHQLADVWRDPKIEDGFLVRYDAYRKALNDSPFDRAKLNNIEFTIEPEFIYESIAEEYKEYESKLDME